jgi:putative toxin-antitoxin system antitoxin component (TIGR02293 family)
MPRAGSKRKHPARPPGLAEEERPFAHEDVVRGIEARKVKGLIERGVLGAKQVHRLIPARTFNRRLAGGQRLTPSESDVIARLVRIVEMAHRILGDAEFAGQWLTLANPVLNERVPIELAETDAGAREVEGALLHLAYGDHV